VSQDRTTYTPEWRHQCLVRALILMRIADRQRAHDWLAVWSKANPQSSLGRDVRDQWMRGNRGNPGEWR
jgi:hypothetical protein